MAFKADIKPSACKFVFVALCDYCNQSGLAYPSIETLAKKTGQDRKTTQKHLANLKLMGVILDTGKRIGKTNGVVVFKVLLPLSDQQAVPKTGQLSDPKNGNDPKNGAIPFFPDSDPKNGTAKRSQKRDTEPPVLLTISKPPEGLNAQAWELWINYRKQRRLAKYVNDGMANRLSAIGHDAQLRCVQDSIDNNYSGIFPDKFKNEKCKRISSTGGIDHDDTSWGDAVIEEFEQRSTGLRE